MPIAADSVKKQTLFCWVLYFLLMRDSQFTALENLLDDVLFLLHLILLFAWSSRERERCFLLRRSLRRRFRRDDRLR